jgi:glycerol-3-phosphate acyltransferase PlsY
MEIFLTILFSYIIGSIPFGLILTKIFSGKDVRKIGSGNIGATNVLRAGNKYLALMTLILDVSKGYVPVFLTQSMFPELIQISGLMTFLGHIFPIWLKFKGGKGVATYLGVLIAISFGLSVLFVFTWIIVSLIFKYSSLSSMFSSLTVLVVYGVKDKVIKAISSDILLDNDFTILLFIFFILILFTHKKNISSLKDKKESKIKI